MLWMQLTKSGEFLEKRKGRKMSSKRKTLNFYVILSTTPQFFGNGKDISLLGHGNSETITEVCHKMTKKLNLRNGAYLITMTPFPTKSARTLAKGTI